MENDGAARAFEGMYALVVIEPDGQAIAQCAGLAQIFDVAAMEQVEAAVGEDEGLASGLQLMADGEQLLARDVFARRGFHDRAQLVNCGRGANLCTIAVLCGVCSRSVLPCLTHVFDQQRQDGGNHQAYPSGDGALLLEGRLGGGSYRERLC